MDEISKLLIRGVEKIYPSREALEKVLRSGKKLKLYQGFDPTGDKLHIGHMIGLRKLRQWQDLGHEVIFLIGDFTATIGDPSGKSESRKTMTHEEVLKNAKDYKDQAGRILNFSGENPVKIKYNSEWLGKIKTPDFLRLIHYFSAQQIIKRDMFQDRLKNGQDLFLNEFFYPVLQAYDSVAMNVDVEVGGNDQLFNMLAGRDLMHKMKRKNKFVMTTPLLVDSAGKKIGKTEGNVIALTAKPADFFGMIMNLGDDVIVKCFEYLTDIPMSQVAEISDKIKNGENPMVFKKKLALTLTTMLNNNAEAKKAQEEFEKVHQSGGMPENIPVFKLADLSKNPLNLVDLLSETKLASSRSEAKRLISQKAVEINQQSAINNQQLTIKADDTIKVGNKRWLKFK